MWGRSEGAGRIRSSTGGSPSSCELALARAGELDGHWDWIPQDLENRHLFEGSTDFCHLGRVFSLAAPAGRLIRYPCAICGYCFRCLAVPPGLPLLWAKAEILPHNDETHKFARGHYSLPCQGVATKISGSGAALCRRLHIPSCLLNPNLHNRPSTNPQFHLGSFRFFLRSLAPSLFPAEFHFLEGPASGTLRVLKLFRPSPSFIFLLCGAEVSAWGLQVRTSREKSLPSLVLVPSDIEAAFSGYWRVWVVMAKDGQTRLKSNASLFLRPPYLG